MKAAVFHGSRKPLTLEDLPTPSPGPGEVLVKVAGCGLCHTDLHYLDHDVPTFKKPPVVLGHEASGTVAAIGAGTATRLKEGDPVLVPAVYGCRECAACRTGRDNICDRMVMFGNNVDGGFAEHMIAPASCLVPLPPEMPLVESAIIADATTTPFHAVVNRGKVKPGDRVLVVGCGGVGLNAVQIAAAVGGQVIAVDIREDKLVRARALGAAATVNASSVERLDKEIRRLTGGGGADVAFEIVGTPATQEQALSCVRAGGRLVLVGYSEKPMSLAGSRVMFREMEVVGSLGCPGSEYPRVIEMARTGRIRVAELVTAKFPLEKINDALDGLRRGEGVRTVIVP